MVLGLPYLTLKRRQRRRPYDVKFAVPVHGKEERDQPFVLRSPPPSKIPFSFFSETDGNRTKRLGPRTTRQKWNFFEQPRNDRHKRVNFLCTILCVYVHTWVHMYKYIYTTHKINCFIMYQHCLIFFRLCIYHFLFLKAETQDICVFVFIYVNVYVYILKFWNGLS